MSIEYVPAIAEDAGNEGDGKVDNIGRTFGATNVFRPQKVLSREGVTVLNVFGFHSGDPTKKRTVAAALQPSSAAP